MSPRRACAAVALALLVSACATRAAVPAPPAAAARTALEALQAELDALFMAPAVQHAHWGIKVVSLRDRSVVYSQNPAEFLIPASNQKFLTTVAAAERLGWDFRFTTRVLATAPIGSDGTLNGDLIVVGDGDPTINPRHPERWNAFDRWAMTLKEKGLRVVAGNIVGDDNAFAEPGWGVGWAWDNLQDGYGAPIGALQYNENQIEVMVGPGLSPGLPAIIATSPIGSGMVIVNSVQTAAADAVSAVDLARLPGTPHLHVRGQIAAGAKPVTVLGAVHNPTTFYLEGLREALGRHGIVVSGSMADIDALHEEPATDGRIELIVDRSATLLEMIDVLMKWSRNGYAETLLAALAPPGEAATGTRGLETVRTTLAAFGLPPESYLPRDGSGLSRYDYISADALTTLLASLAAHPTHAEPYRSTLPVAGVSGTLANRMKGTAAEGRVVAKTGSLSNVRSLSGYLTTAAGEPMVFAILVNNFRVSNAEIDAITDKALARIVDFAR
jgi:D-alanyl-D-alanine carboxypeptidase/D-alanyl-D-alanine-endopeptidase (penicillin-binding protein 4)